MSQPASADLANALGVDPSELYTDWFNKVAAFNPDARLIVNDYDIISEGALAVGRQDAYWDVIASLDDAGAQVDMIGIQGHLHPPYPAPTQVLSVLDRYAQTGKKITISELDFLRIDDGLADVYARDFLTAVFSHPAVDSILMWGFNDATHYNGDAILFDEDWNLKPAGEAYIDLVFNEWWTPDAELMTDENGMVEVCGFYGDYEFTVESDGNIYTLGAAHEVDGEEITLSLEGQIPTAVSTEIISNKISALPVIGLFLIITTMTVAIPVVRRRNN